MSRGALLALCLVSVLAGCKKAAPATDAAATPDAAAPRLPEKVVLTGVTLRAKNWVGPDGMDEPDAVRYQAIVVEALRTTDLFATVDPGAVPGFDVRRAALMVDYELDTVPPGPSQDGEVTASVVMKLVWEPGSERDDGEPEVASYLMTQTTLTPAQRGAVVDLVRAHMERSFRDATAELFRMERIRRADPDTLASSLTSEDEQVRTMAAQVVASRKVREVVPTLLDMVKAEDPATRDTAIGLLVELREPRAVKVLTEISRFDDLDTMRRIIDAIAIIGGEEARTYLEFVASGHESELIQEMARSALERMTRP